MFSPSIAFVDLETTGTLAAGDRITEVGIVRVDDGTQVSEWNSLVNPECSIPGAIQALTGITNAMVAGAPTFAQVAEEISRRIAGCIFVAHNARFDYAFLKHEFARLGRSFSAKALCTVKRLAPALSRRAAPQPRQPHRASPARRRRSTSRARGCAAAVAVHTGPVPRPSRRGDRRRRRAHPQDTEPAPTACAGHAGQASGESGCLSLLRPQRAAPVHRQEHQPAGAYCCALFIRLPERERSAAFRRDTAHRVRRDCR